MDEDIVRQELYCHECGNYVQFELDLSLNGNHVIVCPVCGHEHCRVIENGRITDVRWDSRNNRLNNRPTIYVSPHVTSSSSVSITQSALSGNAGWVTYSANSTTSGYTTGLF